MFLTLLAGLLSALMTVSSQSASDSAKGTVYVYRYKQFVGMALKPSVYCDNEEIARMQNGRYFALTLEPGEHELRSNDAQSGIALDVTGGETYFIRVEIATGLAKGHGRLVSVVPAQGRVEVVRLEPSDRDTIRDTRRVSLKAFSLQPSELSHSTSIGPAARTPDVGGLAATPKNGPRPAAQQSQPLTNEDIVALAHAELSDTVIIAKIRASRTAFALEPNDLVALKKSGVSNDVITAMIAASK